MTKYLYLFCLCILSHCGLRYSNILTEPNLDKTDCVYDTCEIVTFTDLKMAKFKGRILLNYFPVDREQRPRALICVFDEFNPDKKWKSKVDAEGEFDFDLPDGLYVYAIVIDEGFQVCTGYVHIRKRRFWLSTFHVFNIPYCW
ncbi:MAG: hypothetical protein CSA81_05320 [Acidobacteria bacterium]|nr:MAG: hypothetical protein CSA81_05320 [Acidobacteriota bacterium]PIE90992.1 MAG: hypothetical protein CR997_03790 [Acidobacteriota bacterium]